jgi:D-glycero-D-manno-heptose 1,7-bisphosphate phosphatase
MTQKAVFLDRDGTLIHDPGYINHPSQVKLLPGVGPSLAQLNKMGYRLVIVTNQSGVARGLVTEQGLGEIHHQLKILLADEGVDISAIYYCPFHPDGTIEHYKRESDLRKPAPGMLLKAAKELNIDLSHSWMIGDSYRDTTAGSRAGCQTILLDTPGRTQERQPNDPEPTKRAVNLREAVNILRMVEFQQKAQAARKDAESAASASPSKEPNQPPVPQEQPFQPTAAPAPKGPTPPAVEEESVAKEKKPQDKPRPPLQQSAPLETPPPAADNVPKQEPSLPSEEESTPTQEPSLSSAAQTHHQMIEEILHRVKSKTRYDQYDEFSVFMLLAWLVQALAAFSLVVSIWFWLDTARGLEAVQTMIGYAIALQLLVIAMLLMHDKNK